MGIALHERAVELQERALETAPEGSNTARGRLREAQGAGDDASRHLHRAERDVGVDRARGVGRPPLNRVAVRGDQAAGGFPKWFSFLGWGTVLGLPFIVVCFVLTAVVFADERTGFAVGHDAVILRSTDAGETWELMYADAEEESPLLDVFFFDVQRGIGAQDSSTWHT